MKLQEVLFSPTLNKFVFWLGQTIPPWLGYKVAHVIASVIAKRRKALQVRAARANQWVLSGKELQGKALDKAVKQVYLANSRCLYDYYHYSQNHQAILEMIKFDESFTGFVERSYAKKEGTLGVILHMGSFDLAGYAIALRGLDPLVLSYPHPNDGYRWHNELRKRAGLMVEPLSMKSLQQATRYLRKGGTIITGIDRPWPDTKYHPRLFGEPTDIPVTTIQMAIQTNVPITLIACIRQKDHTYRLYGSPMINMQSYPDRHEELVKNTEHVLSYAEPFLKKYPHQWAMFYPVWPQAIKSMP